MRLYPIPLNLSFALLAASGVINEQLPNVNTNLTSIHPTIITSIGSRGRTRHIECLQFNRGSVLGGVDSVFPDA
ncbi:hypothetical protein F5051DRAFT_423668 [Lentinula edodes]|nr:hypothetical protein F5051DRAFT_423668 [Lentinula edodes]